MVTATNFKPDIAPHTPPKPKQLDSELLQPQILQDIRVSNMNLPSIILECSLNGKRVINSDENLNKSKYVPIAENIIARVHSKNASNNLDSGSVKCIRKVELIRFKILEETQEVTDIEQDTCDYILLKSRDFQASSEQEMHREIFFLNKYANQPGILPIVAQYSYTSKSVSKNIRMATKKAIVMRRLQDLFTLKASSIKQGLPLSSSTQLLDFVKKEAKKQLLEAILAIHAHGDIHRDIKLENALWEQVDDTLKFYIIDFDATLEKDELDKIESLKGTFKYCDPQIPTAISKVKQCKNKSEKQEIYKQITSQKNDIFSLGLMFYLLRESTHKLPYEIEKFMNDRKTDPFFKFQNGNLSSRVFFRTQIQDQYLFKIGSFEHLVWRMLRPNPEERITTQEAYEELTRINSRTEQARCEIS